MKTLYLDLKFLVALKKAEEWKTEESLCKELKCGRRIEGPDNEHAIIHPDISPEWQQSPIEDFHCLIQFQDNEAGQVVVNSLVYGVPSGRIW